MYKTVNVLKQVSNAFKKLDPHGIAILLRMTKKAVKSRSRGEPNARMNGALLLLSFNTSATCVLRCSKNYTKIIPHIIIKHKIPKTDYVIMRHFGSSYRSKYNHAFRTIYVRCFNGCHTLSVSPTWLFSSW